MDKIIVIVGGIGLIAFIYWFFFGKKESVSEVSASEGKLNIVVDGGYRPATIRVKKGRKIVFSIIRNDPSSCLEELILPDFKISKYLPLNKEVKIEFTPNKTGEFGFHCGMNMFHGKLIVEE